MNSKNLQLWWSALFNPESAGQLVLGRDIRPGFDRFLAIGATALYAFYGATMGLFRCFGDPAQPFQDQFIPGLPAMVSALKLPFLFLFSLAICFPALYLLNCMLGPRLTIRQCARLLLLAASANAAALASFGFFSIFFTLTSSTDGYAFIVMMHILVFAAAGIASLAVIALVFRATADELGIRLHLLFILGWSVLYGFVGTQMSWVLRPWIGDPRIPYAIIRPPSGSFYEALWRLIRELIKWLHE